jgi:hypothetical protein
VANDCFSWGFESSGMWYFVTVYTTRCHIEDLDPPQCHYLRLISCDVLVPFKFQHLSKQFYPLQDFWFSEWCCRSFVSSGMWYCVVRCVASSISRDHSAFIFRFEQSTRNILLLLDTEDEGNVIHQNIWTTHPRTQCCIPEWLYLQFHPKISTQFVGAI